jgi:hypothetical protein
VRAVSAPETVLPEIIGMLDQVGKERNIRGIPAVGNSPIRMKRGNEG